MKRRILFAFATAAAAAVVACDSGLGDVPEQFDVTGANLRFGFDPGFPLTSPIIDRDAVGAMIDGQSVVLYSFTTSADAADADGAGGRLDRDGASDGNGAEDVFLGIVVADRIDPTGFDQAIAGVLRSPRCMTCHSMNAAPDVDPLVDDFISFTGHPLPQGNLDGDNDPTTSVLTTCTACHKNAADWRAPGPEKDFRRKTLAELAAMVSNPPAGQTPQVHFQLDPRVDWALGTGFLPDPAACSDVLVGCGLASNDNPADDDRDGIAEPSDTDGVPRTIPGGKQRFTERITAWFEGTRRTDSVALALGDLALVSQVAGVAGNGASSAPSVAFEPQTGPGGLVGYAHVAFESLASDLVPGDSNATFDVFRATLRVERAGESFRLAYDSTLLVSQNTLGNSGNGSSTQPSIGGANGQLVSFDSRATDLIAGFSNQNGISRDVWVRDVTAGAESTRLVSFSTTTSTGGNGSSSASDLSADGEVVAFQSNASNLAFGSFDTNASSDIFYLRLGATPLMLARASVQTGGFQAGGGNSRLPSVATRPDGVGGLDVRIAFESDKLDLVPDQPPFASTNVFVHDSAGLGTTTLLAQRRTEPTRGTVARAFTFGGVDAAADSFRPTLSPDGELVAFDTLAENLDVLRPRDDSNGADVLVADLSRLDEGVVLPYRASVSAEGGTASKASQRPILGSFGGGRFAQGFVLFETEARNLGASDNTDELFVFLAERPRAVADFTSSATTGGAPLTVQFQDASLGTASGWSWDFGDGNTSNEENPTHVYTDPAGAPYDVSLVVETDMGTADIVKPGLAVPFQLVSDFSTVGGTSITQGEAVSFISQSNDPTAITSRLWDFGAGEGTSALANPSHVYGSQGNFTVSLTTTWANGTVLVETKPAFVSVANGVASFNVSTQTTDMGDVISFTNTSTGVPVSRSWNFGDGTFSSAVNPNKSYAEPGSYEVRLTNTYASGPPAVSSATVITVHATFDRVWDRLSGSNHGLGSCTVCHAGGSASALAALNFSSQAIAYNALTAGGVQGCGDPYVTVGNPGASYLLNRILGSCNSQMTYDTNTVGPDGNAVPLSHRNEIASWINGGAQNN